MKTDDMENAGIVEIKRLCAQYGISTMELSMHIQVTCTRIYEILSGKRRITASTDLRLCHFFKLESGYFAKLQTEYDLAIEARNLKNKLKKIKTVDEIIHK